MTQRRVVFIVPLLIVALVPCRGQAGLIPWNYQWNAQPVVIDADPLGPQNRPAGGIALTPGGISITSGNPGVALGNDRIVAVNLTAFTFAPNPDGKPYSFTNSPYRLGITLTDVDSKKSGTLNFAGALVGSFTDWTVDLRTHFTSATRQSLILGQNRYMVNLTTFTPPDPPAEGGEGNISATVSVQPVSAHEPSALVLVSCGLAALFSGLRRRALA